MAHVGGVGVGSCAGAYGGFGTSTGEILVLFILLVIITGSGFWGV
nr:hypothetical protein [Paenibacillus periandrae]